MKMHGTSQVDQGERTQSKCMTTEEYKNEEYESSYEGYLKG